MIALAHGDGTAWPNFALATLASYLRSRGEEVRLVRLGDRRNLWDRPSAILGSSVFSHSAEVRTWLEREWGAVTWGGTGIWRAEGARLETGPVLGPEVEACLPDYSLYPDFKASLGFTQRGCRLRCGFCVVPTKEGRPRAVRSVPEIWRGPGHPRNLLLLDNDTFGQPREEWLARFRELRAGNFKVCFAQGINVRLINEEAARELATIRYSSTKFQRRRLYCAWDNLGDEDVVKTGIRGLVAGGVPARHLMVYMLVGFAPGETWDAVLYRFRELVALGCLPYPMVFERQRARDPSKGGHPDPSVRAHVKKLLAFARWATTGLYRAVPWAAYNVRIKKGHS